MKRSKMAVILGCVALGLLAILAAVWLTGGLELRTVTYSDEVVEVDLDAPDAPTAN